ncbi:hypothetical protein PsorP6_003729 [Peronosclerospora sorghi]|uniref:Uncharacterized protein n=1 Tax=Peronosclerospora sorghi TaxID=230839 RepID=A0ACC0VPF4_9STRA|nr:hypothetical protein PsorP6_003729 [Peronosclerospora sorghi]
MKSDRVAILSYEDDWLQQLPLSVLYDNLFDVPALKSNLATKLDTMIPVSALYGLITDEASGVKENRFAFIRQLLSYFSFDDLSIETDALKHLAIKTSRRISGTLTCLVRTLCERFVEHAEMLGTYLGFVIDEISEIYCSAVVVDP